MAWCGFIDLLGTKASANSSETKLKLGLVTFQQTLKANQAKLKNGKCFAFSDGAFFESEDLSSLYEFYASVRRTLFSGGHFFKCSVVPGALDVTIDRVGDSRKRLEELSYLSISFLGNAPSAYIAEESFKGVGATVECEKLDNEVKDYLVKSFYLSGDRYGTLSSTWDFRYPKSEIGGLRNQEISDDHVFDDEGEESYEDSLLELFLSEFSQAKTRSRNYGRYYLSALAAMVRSEDYRHIEYENGEWQNEPYLFYRLLVDNNFEKSFRGVSGLKFLYWALVDEVLKQQGSKIDDELFGGLIFELMKRPFMFNELDEVPQDVLAGEHRDEVLVKKGRIEAVLRTKAGGRR